MPLPTWSPDLSSLDLLLSVARLGSVGRAAAEHSISQPSASTRLAHLERQLGVALLVRTSRGSTLTPAGEAVAAWAQNVVEAAQALTDGVGSLRDVRAARLRVAASLTVAEYLLPTWLLVLRREHRSDLAIAATVVNSTEVCALVRSGQADLGFVEMPEPPADLSCEVVGIDRLVLVVAPTYPLAARGSSGVPARELPDQPLLVREPGSGTREVFIHALTVSLGAPPALPHATELGSTATIIGTARAGGGIGVVSARAVAGELAGGTLTEISVPDLDLSRRLHAVWQGKRASNLAHELVRIASD